jgi:hypothetical protein
MTVAKWNEVKVGDSRLVLHCGAHAVTENEVFAAITPEATESHFPIPHSMLLQSVTNTLSDLGWAVRESAHALMNDGARYFGLLAIRPKVESSVLSISGDGTFDWVIGLRNAHDKAFSADGMLGNRVFVCDNLAFSGRAGSVFHFARKHTRYIERDLPGLVAGSFGNMARAMHDEKRRVEVYRAHEIGDDDQVHDFMIRAMDRRAITPQQLPHVLKEWRRDDGPGGLGEAARERDPAFEARTAWRLLNCFTEVEKQRPSPVASPARNARLVGLLDGLVGLSSSADTVIDAEVA